jgi:hypothetical protein
MDKTIKHMGGGEKQPDKGRDEQTDEQAIK